MDRRNPDAETAIREELERNLLRQRREFLKRALRTCAYVTPVAMSFAARDLARAASCPGVGNCGNSSWAHSM